LPELDFFYSLAMYHRFPIRLKLAMPPTYSNIGQTGDICNKIKLSVAWIFCDTSIRYHNL